MAFIARPTYQLRITTALCWYESYLPLHLGMRAAERLEHDHLSVHATDVRLGERVLWIEQREHLHKQRLIEVGHSGLDRRRACNSRQWWSRHICAPTLVVILCHVREELVE